jgi:hypothetical protein
MGMAFGISPDDVYIVASRRGIILSEEQAAEWFEDIDGDQAEDAALYADDMDEQTDLALANIESQLEEQGRFGSTKPKPVVSPSRSKK